MMNRISPKKLLHSKWTAVTPERKEKHFAIIDIEFDDEANVSRCVMQAVMTKREFEVDWRSLKRSDTWLVGWQ